MDSKSNTMYDQTNTAPYPTNPSYGADTNNAYPPVSSAYPPVASAYPPPQNAYPPTSNYPPPMGSYPPPMAAPPPYSATATPSEPYPTHTTNATVVAIDNTGGSYQPYFPEVGFDSKAVRLGKSQSYSKFKLFSVNVNSRNFNSSNVECKIILANFILGRLCLVFIDRSIDH